MARESTTLIPAAGALVALRFRRILLEVTAGPDSGKQAPLAGRELTVGSHPSNDLVLTDPAVSRFHFRVTVDDHGYRILDDTSTNGTVVNSIAIRDAYLSIGANISIGNTVIALKTGDGEAEIPLSAESRFGEAIGESTAMREAFAVARRAAASAATVLVRGETGTGKDLLARAIHDHGARGKGPFLVFDCAAVPPNLIESALFGHTRGSFTGADRDHLGVFRAADGGTLFLDELGELPLDLQPKLLRALENGEVIPVGSTEPVRVDVRIIAATHRDLREMVSTDRFRPDLYYRLAVLTLDVPPLRARRDDISRLAGHFLTQLVGDNAANFAALSRRLESSLSSVGHYDWPGNVRELRNAVERAVALAESEPESLSLTVNQDSRPLSAPALRGRLPLQLAREQFDREYLRELLTNASGDVKRAAEVAEIHPKSLARLLRRYKIERDRAG